MAVVSHWQLPVFRELRLEESAVLGVHEQGSAIRFDMEFVVGERHAAYKRPHDDQPCYRKGRLWFRDTSEVVWARVRPDAPVEPPDPSADWGPIDSFVFDGARYMLAGRWGKLTLRAGAVDVDVW